MRLRFWVAILAVLAIPAFAAPDTSWRLVRSPHFEIYAQSSDQRAQAISDALSAAGIAANRLQQRGAGATDAVASNQTPQGRMENRRIEIEFRPEPATAP